MDSKSGAGVGMVLAGAGIGAASFFGAAFAGQNVQALQSRWWLTPAALIVIGGLIARKHAPSGLAVAGAGGALAAFSYYVQASQAKASQGIPSTAQGPAQSAAATAQGPSRAAAGALLPGGARMPGARATYGAAPVGAMQRGRAGELAGTAGAMQRGRAGELAGTAGHWMEAA